MTGQSVVVWGNCQAAPLAALLTAPLAAHGLRVVPVPPVFEVHAADLERVRAEVAQAAVLITHPVRDEYHVPGCGSQQLAALLPPGGRTVRVSPAYHVGPFPYLVDGHDADGRRVDAPLTGYHDLTVVAQFLGRPVPELTPARAAAVAGASLAELTRRERDLEVPVTAYLRRPGALYTFNHPTNPTLVAIAQAVLGQLGLTGRVCAPDRPFLGATRAPVPVQAAAAVGWRPRVSWQLAGRRVSAATVRAAHVEFYDRRPDVADATWQHATSRRALLGLMS